MPLTNPNDVSAPFCSDQTPSASPASPPLGLHALFDAIRDGDADRALPGLRSFARFASPDAPDGGEFLRAILGLCPPKSSRDGADASVRRTLLAMADLMDRPDVLAAWGEKEELFFQALALALQEHWEDAVARRDDMEAMAEDELAMGEANFPPSIDDAPPSRQAALLAFRHELGLESLGALPPPVFDVVSSCAPEPALALLAPLAEAGADFFAPTPLGGGTPLFRAAARGLPMIVQALLAFRQDAEPELSATVALWAAVDNCRQNNARSPAVSSQRWAQTVSLLLPRADLGRRDEDGQSVFHHLLRKRPWLGSRAEAVFCEALALARAPGDFEARPGENGQTPTQSLMELACLHERSGVCEWAAPAIRRRLAQFDQEALIGEMVRAKTLSGDPASTDPTPMAAPSRSARRV
jgi:hypothetical protein